MMAWTAVAVAVAEELSQLTCRKLELKEEAAESESPDYRLREIEAVVRW